MKLYVIAMIVCGSAAAQADTLFASDHDGTLVISKLAGDAVQTVYEEPQSGALEYGWSDAHTLWVLRGKAGFSIGKVVDGVAKPVRRLSRDDWQPKTTDGPTKRAPHLVITKKREVYLARCVDLVKEKYGTSCRDVFLRVDASSPVLDKLADRKFVGPTWEVLPNGSDDPPTGWKFVVSRSGFTCSGPGKKKFDFKAGTRSVEGMTWFSADPAIVRFGVFRADGGGFDGEYVEPKEPADPFVTPISTTDDGSGWFFLEDCTTFLANVVAVGPDAIATTEGDKAWKLRRGKTVLSTFTATRVVAAPPS